MRESSGRAAEYVRGRSFPVGFRGGAVHTQEFKLAEVDVPREQGFPLFVGGAVGTEGAHILEVVGGGNVRELGGLNEGEEECGGIRPIDGLGEEPVLPTGREGLGHPFAHIVGRCGLHDVEVGGEILPVRVDVGDGLPHGTGRRVAGADRKRKLVAHS